GRREDIPLKPGRRRPRRHARGRGRDPIETAIDPAADIKRGFGELSDLPVPVTVAPSAHVAYLHRRARRWTP
ncbi:MAG TPA: hypothetical protein VFH80_33405, partial [Solirubrobacteraceae bacterium]|nr:hypothetical protein [Solirubrobacteraceae bacterium]